MEGMLTDATKLTLTPALSSQPSVRSCLLADLERALQDVRAASVRALTDASVLTLSRALFSKLLGSLADIRHMWRFEALNKVS